MADVLQDGGLDFPLVNLPSELLANIFVRLNDTDHPDSSSACSMRQACSWLKTTFDNSNTHLRLGGRGGNPAQGDTSLSSLVPQGVRTRVQQHLSALVLATPHLTSLHLPYDSPWLPWSTLMDICGPVLPRLTRLTLWHDRRCDYSRFVSYGNEPPYQALASARNALFNSGLDPWTGPPHPLSLQPLRESPSMHPLVAAAPSLTHLDFGGCLLIDGISSLSALTSLQHLSMQGCRAIKDLAPLSTLSRLAHLNISHSGVENLSPLTNCTSLTHLDTSMTSVADALCALPTIITLIAQGCGFQGPGAFFGCPSLTHLDLADCCDLESVELSGCPSLTHLNLQGCDNLDFDGLASCPSLTHLILSCMVGFSLPGLASYSSVVCINLRESEELGDISELSGCHSLAHLCLIGCASLKDISALSSCTSLVHLDLSDCDNIVALAGLSGCSSLTHLGLNGCSQLADISALSGCVSLTHLDFYGCSALMGISALSACSSLAHLNLHKCCSISDITALSGCPSLTHLDLSTTEISTLSGLSGCSSLTHLDLDGCTFLEDIGALSGCTSLAHLNLNLCENLGSLGALSGLPLTFFKVHGHILQWAGFPLPPSLSDLNIRGRCGVDARAMLAPLTALKQLSLDSMSLSFPPAPPLMLPLVRLDLSSHINITDLEALSHFPQLFTLDLADCPRLTSLSGLRFCPQLRHLTLRGCSRLTDLNALSTLNALARLDLASTMIRDLQPLQACSRLTELRVGGRDCFLYRTPIVLDLQPLTACLALRELWVTTSEGCDVTGTTLVGGTLPDVQVHVEHR